MKCKKSENERKKYYKTEVTSNNISKNYVSSKKERKKIMLYVIFNNHRIFGEGPGEQVSLMGIYTEKEKAEIELEKLKSQTDEWDRIPDYYGTKKVCRYIIIPVEENINTDILIGGYQGSRNEY